MNFKDDAVYMWNKRQWGYYQELFYLYDIASISDNAEYILECYCKDNEEYIQNIIDSGAEEEDVLDIFEDIQQHIIKEDNINQS